MPNLPNLRQRAALPRRRRRVFRGRRDDPSSRGEVPRGDARGGRPPHGGSRAARPGDGRWRWPRGCPTRARRRRRRRRARRARHPGTPRAHPEEWPGNSDDTAEKLGRQMSGASRVADFEIEPFEPRTFSTRGIKTFRNSEGSSRGSTARVPHKVAHGAHPRAVPSTRHPNASPHVAPPAHARAERDPLSRGDARSARIFLDGTSSRQKKPCTSRRCASMGSSRTRSARSCPRSRPSGGSAWAGQRPPCSG